MTSAAQMNALQVAYDNRSDPRFEGRSDGAVEAVSIDLCDDLLTTGRDDVDDESVQLRIDIDAMRRAYALAGKGGFDAALFAFKAVFEDACQKAANDEAPGVYARICRDAEESAAADRADARAGQ